jgi:hypothetical protein
MAEEDGLIREIDDAVKQDQLKEFWERFGKHMAVGAAIVVLVAGGYLFRLSQERSASIEASDALWQANRLLDEGGAENLKQAESLLLPQAEAKNPLSVVAQLKLAEVYSKTGEAEKRTAVLADAAAQKGILAQFACSQLVAAAPAEAQDCAKDAGSFQPYLQEILAVQAVSEGRDDVVLPEEPAGVMQQNRLEPLRDYLASRQQADAQAEAE